MSSLWIGLGCLVGVIVVLAMIIDRDTKKYTKECESLVLDTENEGPDPRKT